MNWCSELASRSTHWPVAGVVAGALKSPLAKRRLVPWQRSVFATLLVLAVGFLSDSVLIYAKAGLAQYLIKEAWQQTVETGLTGIKPWPWADTWPVARLQSVNQGVDMYVLNGAQGNALAFGPGYLQASAAPGSNGASIIAGHRDTHFQFMQQLEVGDVLLLTDTTGHSRRYNVVALEVVDSSKQPHLYVEHNNAKQDWAQMILVTCYPFESLDPGGPLRYVARAVAADSA